MTFPDTSQTVLIVDDEWLLRLHARDFIECAGFDVVEAANGDEALDVLAAHNDIAVLFTDINMPGSMDGLQLARRVHERYPDVKLLLTSGKIALGEDEIPADGVFISKPYAPESVVGKIESLLS